ncbi:hypothetical protein ZEAMMB73_Zm00001d036224 [Zea mays]|uniref:Uncharacterized protein n=1 Tax=Zea mays TaxID=4577 RepID=A0A1D6LL99_MAIZE|nr:hypothetical protein ZEAMMB73_Zm00001d036224 [Zea mays]
MSAAADDRARRAAAFRPAPLPPPAQKQQLSGVAAAVLDAGGRLGRAVGDVFRRLRIDDTFYSGGGGGGGGAPNRSWRDAGNNGGRPAAAGAPAAASREEATGGGASSGRFARAQGSMNLSATYDSRTHDVESSVVARGDLWRAEASHSSSSSAGAGGNGANNNLFLVQLGPVLFVRDTTLLFPVHLSKRHLIWYGFERKSFMDMQFPNGQLRYVAGDGFTARAFLPLRGGVLQAHGKFPGEKRLSFSFKDSICPTIGGRHPGVCVELIHSADDNVGVVCGYSHTASSPASAYASISIGRSKLNGGAARSGLAFRVDAPLLHGFGRPWFSVQMNSGIEF